MAKKINEDIMMIPIKKVMTIKEILINTETENKHGISMKNTNVVGQKSQSGNVVYHQKNNKYAMNT
jgi:hypothetical protein